MKFTILVLLSVLIVCATPHAVALDRAAVEKLALGDGEERLEAIAALITEGDARAVEVLDALASGDLQVAGKRVLVRVDLNVPMKDGRVTDDLRISRVLPTLHELARKGAKVVVLSHFDRPKGKRVPSMSLAPLAPALAKLLGKPVAFADD